MLYPLSYEGELLRIARIYCLFGVLGQVHNVARCAFGPHLGRTVTSIHRFCEAIDEQCSHLTHTGDLDRLDRRNADLNRSAAQIAAIDHTRGTPTDDIDPFGPSPPSSDVAAQVAWQIAKRLAERDETHHVVSGLDLAAGR